MIVTARKLAKASVRRPRQADLKRAISTAYYALLHAIAKDAADLLAGVGANRPDKAWAQLYRALQHGDAKSACEAAGKLNFPDTLLLTADAFVTLQKKRHDADYDPNYRTSRQETAEAIDLADQAIQSLKGSERKDRKAFAILLLLKKRKS